VLVYPKASRNEIIELVQGTLRVRISAPPIRGKANKELIDFLSRVLGIGKGSVNIVKGKTGRNKVVTISGLTYEDVIARIQDPE
jgi:hypothetical protein